MGKYVHWGKVFLWILAIGGIFYLLKNVRTKWVWLILFILVGGYGFMRFMKWIIEEDTT